MDNVNTPTPVYAMDAAAELLKPLHCYYAQMEERPTFNEFAFQVAEWFTPGLKTSTRAMSRCWT